MGNIVHNIAKGHPAEYVARVNANDPTNSVFLMRFLANSGLEADSVLIDKDDWSALVSGTTDFATNTGAVTKTFDQTGGLTRTVDDTNDRVALDAPDTTWTAVANDGTGAIGALVIGYDSDSTAGTDANVVPVSKHDFAVTPDGSDITAQIADFIRAT